MDNLGISFKDYHDQQVQHRHQHPLIRDPSTRKHARTVPAYMAPKMTPKGYNDFKKQKPCPCKGITNTDVAKLQKLHNVKDLPVGKVKGLKRTGVGLVKQPNGLVKMVKTK